MSIRIKVVTTNTNLADVANMTLVTKPIQNKIII